MFGPGAHLSWQVTVAGSTAGAALAARRLQLTHEALGEWSLGSRRIDRDEAFVGRERARAVTEESIRLCEVEEERRLARQGIGLLPIEGIAVV